MPTAAPIGSPTNATLVLVVFVLASTATGLTGKPMMLAMVFAFGTSSAVPKMGRPVVSLMSVASARSVGFMNHCAEPR